jgi:phospho-N-acetylmuramoyl-pentapeptide-transferase
VQARREPSGPRKLARASMLALNAVHPSSSPGAGGVLIASAASLVLCLFISPKFIELLRRRSVGQHIREELVQHLEKAGTPTMGGIIVVIAFAIPYLCLSTRDPASIGVFVTVLAGAFLGFLDDHAKLRRRRSLGVRGRTKLIGMAGISIMLWLIATRWAHISTSVPLTPFHAHVDLGPFFVVLIYLVVAGTTNGVNLADGVDGLLGGCCAITLLAYVGITFITPGDHDLEIAAGCMCGACVGFIWFNCFPATVFMGDTGSLALGGGIAALAVMTGTELLLILIGGIFVLETLSVIIQVFSFRRFGRRVFRMTPIHHHFELAAWSETKITIRFWTVAAVCGAAGYSLYQFSLHSGAEPRDRDTVTRRAPSPAALARPPRSSEGRSAPSRAAPPRSS